jgi:hypothetical protein
MIPFEAVYGQPPPSFVSYMPGVSKVQQVDQNLTFITTILRTLKEKLVMAQNLMKQQDDQGHYTTEWWYNTSYHTATHMTPFE